MGEEQSGTRSDIQPSRVAGTKEAAALRDFDPAYDRYGSKADEATLRGNVRFTPESGHGSARRECPLCARRFDHFVAVASSVGGMAMPRVLAVRRLMTSLLAPEIGRASCRERVKTARCGGA